MADTLVAGLDLSLTSTGVALISDTLCITLRRVQSKGSRIDTLDQRWMRLATLTDDVCSAVVSLGVPQLVVVEGPSYHSTGAGTHDRSGFWWLVVDRLAAITDVAEVPPASRTKYLVGKGNASKDEVLAAAVRRYRDVDITCNDVADAVGLAAMGARAMGLPIEKSLPATNAEACKKIAWTGVAA